MHNTTTLLNAMKRNNESKPAKQQSKYPYTAWHFIGSIVYGATFAIIALLIMDNITNY